MGLNAESTARGRPWWGRNALAEDEVGVEAAHAGPLWGGEQLWKAFVQ